MICCLSYCILFIVQELYLEQCLKMYVFFNASILGSDDGFEEPNNKHLKLWPNLLDVDDTGKEIKIYTDKIEAVSDTKIEHSEITTGNNDARLSIQSIQISTFKDKDAEGSDQDDSFHQESEMKNVQTRTFAEDTTECSEASIPVKVINLEKTATTDDLSSPKKENAILSSQNTQKEVVICQIDDQHSMDITESEGDSEEVAVKKDEYVYRLLRFNEDFRRGLRPKNIDSKTSLKEHVENGSNEGAESRFISCCKTIDGLEELASLTNKPKSVRLVVRINITMLDPKEVKVIDLTDESVRLKYFKSNSRACKVSSRFDEVILEPKTCIPGNCIQKIGTVRQRSFRKNSNSTL